MVFALGELSTWVNGLVESEKQHNDVYTLRASTKQWALHAGKGGNCIDCTVLGCSSLARASPTRHIPEPANLESQLGMSPQTGKLAIELSEAAQSMHTTPG